jgi:hypothetical protein
LVAFRIVELHLSQPPPRAKRSFSRLVKAKNLVEQKKANRPEPRSKIIVSPLRTQVRSLLTPGSPCGKRADEGLGFCTGRLELGEIFRCSAGDEQFFEGIFNTQN